MYRIPLSCLKNTIYCGWQRKNNEKPETNQCVCLYFIGITCITYKITQITSKHVYRVQVWSSRYMEHSICNNTTVIEVMYTNTQSIHPSNIN